MRLYAGSSEEFIADSVHNRIADKLKTAFFGEFRYKPSPGEVSSWRNSLRALSQVFQDGEFKGHGVLLEYELPLTSYRLDCLITGRDSLLNDQAAIIELKQWEKCEEGDSDKVVTFVGGNNRDVLHPSVQVGQYRRYLADYQPAFFEGESPIGLRACSYLHNYTPKDGDALFALTTHVEWSKLAAYTRHKVLSSTMPVSFLGRTWFTVRENVGSASRRIHLIRWLNGQKKIFRNL